MKKIAEAIIKVRTEIKGLEKNMSVGSGSYGYKGISDYEVKKLIKPLLDKHGLIVYPSSIESKSQVSSWEDSNNRRKQSVFTEVNTKYTILHTSGESIEIAGYGHGVDTQDKGAGKATTYALKYAMLYTFFIPTGKIDDTDNTHSEDLTQSIKTKVPPKESKAEEYQRAKAFASTTKDLQKLLKSKDWFEQQGGELLDLFNNQLSKLQAA